MRDVLADILKLVRLKAAVYFLHDFRAPWGIRIPARPHAQFHRVLAGAAVVTTDEQTIELTAGEAILFARGAAHVISDESGEIVRDGARVVPLIVKGESPFGRSDELQENDAATTTRLVSGHFEFAAGRAQRLLFELPDVLHILQTERENQLICDALLSILSDELQQPQPGAEMIVERLAEIWLVQTLRAYFAGDDAAARPHLLRAVFNPQLAAAMAVVHERYHEPELRLKDLAASANLSRSAFAGQFKAAARISPMNYLSEWRMLQARELLVTTDHSIAQIAFAVGHQSQEGFSRAFKREFGASPNKFRCR